MHYLNIYGKWLGVQRLEQRENEGLLRPKGVGESDTRFFTASKYYITDGYTHKTILPEIDQSIGNPSPLGFKNNNVNLVASSFIIHRMPAAPIPY